MNRRGMTLVEMLVYCSLTMAMFTLMFRSSYRLLDEGKDLHWWHPLVSGDAETVHKAGISVRGRVVSERDTDDLEGRVVGWPK